MKIYTENFTILLNKHITNKNIDTYEFRVMCYLLMLSDDEGTCYPSYKTIADRTGISETKAKDSIKKLISIGLIKKEKRKKSDGSATSNLYVVFEKTTVKIDEVTEDTASCAQDNLPCCSGQDAGSMSNGCNKYSNINTNYSINNHLANAFLEHCFETNEHIKKLVAYSKLEEQYKIDSKNYPVSKKIIPLMNSSEKYLLAESYTLNSIKDLIFLEMLYSVQRDIYISKCKNCGKYYASANAGADYCDRIFKDNKTCKWVGARKTYISNLKSDDALVLYEKTYQALQYKKRKTDSKSLKNDISATLEKLKKYRETYKQGKLSSEEFINILKNTNNFK